MQASNEMTPAELAQAQLDAYNAKDLDRFVACYAEDVRVWRLPDTEPRLQGREAFRASYAQGPFAAPQVQAEVSERIVMGNKVLDHEWVHGRGDTVQQVMVVYDCHGGLIRNVYFFAPD